MTIVMNGEKRLLFFKDFKENVYGQFALISTAFYILLAHMTVKNQI